MKTSFVLISILIFLTFKSYSQNDSLLILFNKFIPKAIFNINDTTLIFKKAKERNCERCLSEIRLPAIDLNYSKVAFYKCRFIYRKDSLIYYTINLFNSIDFDSLFYFNLNTYNINSISLNNKFIWGYNIPFIINNNELIEVYNYIFNRNVSYIKFYKVKDHQLFVKVKIISNNFWGRTKKIFTYSYQNNHFGLIKINKNKKMRL